MPFAARQGDDRNRPATDAVYVERSHYLARIVGFDAGGFECTVRTVDAQAMADMRGRARGARRPVAERDEVNLVRSVKRSKCAVRQAVKEIGANCMLTLTTRQVENSPDELNPLWKEWCRRFRHHTGRELPYVSVCERHPSNPSHWHMHVAVTLARGGMWGKFLLRGYWLRELDLAKRLWAEVCGEAIRGTFRVDPFDKRGRNLDGSRKDAAASIARYLSKYLTKDLCFAHRPDKKRYWRSEFKMPEPRRYWLAARPKVGEGIAAAVVELQKRFDLDLKRCSFYMFPSGTGFWFSCRPAGDGEAQAPPPF